MRGTLWTGGEVLQGDTGLIAFVGLACLGVRRDALDEQLNHFPFGVDVVGAVNLINPVAQRGEHHCGIGKSRFEHLRKFRLSSQRPQEGANVASLVGDAFHLLLGFVQVNAPPQRT